MKTSLSKVRFISVKSKNFKVVFLRRERTTQLMINSKIVANSFNCLQLINAIIFYSLIQIDRGTFFTELALIEWGADALVTMPVPWADATIQTWCETTVVDIWWEESIHTWACIHNYTSDEDQVNCLVRNLCLPWYTYQNSICRGRLQFNRILNKYYNEIIQVNISQTPLILQTWRVLVRAFRAGVQFML